MDLTETNIKMCEKSEKLQELMRQYKGHLSPPDDGIYHRTDPYPVAVIYDHRPQCSICGYFMSTKYCPNDGGEVKPFLDRSICFGGPSQSNLDNDRIIWLFYQHQLQEVSGLDWRSFDEKCLTYENPERVPTKEQAGIRVVMKEKYNKTWSGKDWVIEKGI